MSSRITYRRVAALLALTTFLPACAQWHCNALPDREQCYAAYDQYETCQVQSRPLIRQVGETWRTDCRTERVSCGKRDRRCVERAREVCRTYSEPIYDYHDYNNGVSHCMRGKGLAAYDMYFGRSLF